MGVELETPPSWLVIARGELGVKEIPGAKSNPRVEEYQHAARGREDDGIAWCSSFCCWAMEQAGIVSPRNGAARSWMKWGAGITAPRLGCIVVLWRESPRGYKGHVGLFERIDEKGRLCLLAGNQGNAVCVRPFPKDRLLGYRWPAEKAVA